MYYSNLYNLTSSYIDLEQGDIEVIKSYFMYGSVAKGAFLIETGKFTDKVFFILSGYLKYFKIIDSGEEIIIHLYSPNSFATSLNSFFLGKKSEESLQAIIDCEFLYITKEDLDRLYSSGYKWHDLGMKIMESALIEKEERIIEQLSLTAQDKYLKIMERNPDIIQNVPIKYIASFIGIQPESLSRIRKIN